MFVFQYCPNRTSRVLDIEIDTREKSPGLWDADCMVYEDAAGVRLFRGGGCAIRDVQANSEDDFMSEAENRITADIEQGRGICL